MGNKVAMSERLSSAARIIEAVNAPLGFFVLALVIVESFLASVTIGGGLESQHQLIALVAGVAMFVMVVLVVAILVWKKPENLTFDKQAHLVRSGASYGTESQPDTDRDALLPSETDG